MRPSEIDEATRCWTVQVRRELHRHPEPTGEEHGTQERVLAYLEELDVPARPAAGTGVLADIEGGRPGPTVALRADMDAIRVQEARTGRNEDYISQNPGVMHACGHDGHMAMVLGAARVLAGMRGDLPGAVRLVFQPHEELHPGGALSMMGAGALEGVGAILGFHIMGYLPAGRLAFRPGPQMAHIRIFYLTITGKGGHHMDPEACIDPIQVASRFVTTVEADAAKALDPTRTFVLGFGGLHGGTQVNQTPDTARLEGTYRTFDTGDADAIEAAMGRTLEGLMATFRKLPGEDLPRYDLDTVRGYPVLRNDPGLAARAAELLPRWHPDVDADTRLNYGAEDFAHYAERVPGLFMFLGTRNEQKGITDVNHSARFDIDEDVLEVGVRALVDLALDLLERP